MISVRNLRKIYKMKGKNGVNDVVALDSVSLDFPDRGLVFLLGKSGSGKSTLLNTVGGLDTFDSGEIIIKGKSSKDFKQSDFDSYRNTFLGFIFQEYNILEEFSVGKNLALALELQGKRASKGRVNELLEQVDLKGYYKRKPNQLSGGQKQRVAIARALIKDPEIIMADEPTGALDSNTGKQVMETLKKLSKTKLVIIVSHDREFAEIYGDRVIELKDGKIIRDETKYEVEPQKSESGVSFIDDKIIHIKKGQKVSREDLIKINQMIVNNTGNNDTIISFDEKSNNDVKKSAFITDNGNREVFVPTQPNDIERASHDPKDFKMIKSKLKMKDSFKMGASSLKHKPIRLIFTILLSVFAFGLFGVVNTMSSFNRADSMYATIEQLGIDTISINKRPELDNYNTYLINDEEYAKFQSDNKGYNLYRVVGSGERCRLVYLSDSYNYSQDQTTKRRNISGVMPINDSIKTEFGLTMEGSMPGNQQVNITDGYNLQAYEICISSNLFEIIKENYTTISTLNDLLGKSFNIDGIDMRFTIVGIVNDNTDISKYKNLKGDNASMNENRFLYEELDIVMDYSLINMCYVHEDVLSACINHYNKMQDGSVRYEAYIKGQEYMGGGYSPNFSIISNSWNSPTYLKSGVSVDTLKDNQAVISKDILTNNFQIADEDLQTKIDNGLTVSFGAGYNPDKNHAFDLEVVGYYNSGTEVAVTETFYKKHFKGASYIITKLKGTSDDKTLVKYFENYKDQTYYYSLQTVSTPVLDNFGGMVEDMANILLYVGIGLAVFSGLMLMNFISISISYKKREIGVLRAIGARGKDVFAIFFSESFIICMINFVLSAIGTGIVCNVINSSLVSNLGVSLTLMIFGFKQILLLLGVSILVAFISSFFPVYRCAKKNPIDSINNR